jgi:uncharacterized protein (TIGR02284 family)
MATSSEQLSRMLNRLHRICKAGERGFEVAAANVSNRGLKVLFKTYAQQRAQFADELQQEIQSLGGSVATRDSLLGIIHRGRITMLANLTIGVQNAENVVLSEAVVGEQAAVSAYKRAVATALPAGIQALVKRQSTQVQEAYDQIRLLRGQDGGRLVVRLFDSEGDAELARRDLERAGFAGDDLEIVDVKQVASVYEGKGSTASETMISGAVGGAIWGGIIGTLAGASALMVPGVQLILGGSPQSAWASIALIGLCVGALIAAVLGLLIGTGASEADAYLYDDSLKHGVKLMRVYTNQERAGLAAQIMHQVNAAARARVTEGALQRTVGK